MRCCHQRPSEPNVIRELSLASGGRSTAILIVTISVKKTLSEEINKNEGHDHQSESYVS
jgi:hypothetical protein